jgi:hypothetical protein
VTGGDATTGRGLWVGLALGAPVMAYGVAGLVERAGLDRAFAAGRWGAGLLVLHDAVLVPGVLVTVWLVQRSVARPWRAPLIGGLLASALAVALALPGVVGLGNPSGNPTVHPYDTGAALAAVLATVWSIAGGIALFSALRARRTRPSPTPTQGTRPESRPST